jgi:DNA primase
VIGEGEPKYLNSPETPLFEKGRELYGLYQARRAIRDANQVIVVEGYMDVVALAQHGVENAVATLGTATTPFHVGKLLKLADNVVFCFDGDSAGRKAAWRALEVSLPVLADGKVVSFLFLPPRMIPIRTCGAWARSVREGACPGEAAFAVSLRRAGLPRGTWAPTKAARASWRRRSRWWRRSRHPRLAAMLRRGWARWRAWRPRRSTVFCRQSPPTRRPRSAAPGPLGAQGPGRAEGRLLAMVLQQPDLASAVPLGSALRGEPGGFGDARRRRFRAKPAGGESRAS